MNHQSVKRENGLKATMEALARFDGKQGQSRNKTAQKKEDLGYILSAKPVELAKLDHRKEGKRTINNEF